MKYFNFTLRRMAALLMMTMCASMTWAEIFYEYQTIHMNVGEVIEWPGIGSLELISGSGGVVSFEVEESEVIFYDQRYIPEERSGGTQYEVKNLKANLPGYASFRGIFRDRVKVECEVHGHYGFYEDWGEDEYIVTWQIIIGEGAAPFTPAPGAPSGPFGGGSGGSGSGGGGIGFHVTPGGVSTSPSGVSVALGAMDIVDYLKGFIKFLSKMTVADVLALLDSSGAPGPDFIEKYRGWFYKLILGTEKFDLIMDVKTPAGTAVGVMMGTDYIGTFTVSDRGTITIPYSLLKEGWFYIFPTTAASPAPVRRLAEAVEEGVTFYGLNFVPENTVLADGTPYSLTCDVPVSSATYTKTIGSDRVGKRQGWLVPFDYTITAEDDAKFSFFKINMIANSPNPEEEASDKMWVFLKPLGVGDVLHANMPYVYKPKEAVTDYEFTTTGATLKAVNNDPLLTMMTAEDTYNIYGIYENTTATALDPFYYVNIYGTISYSSKVTIGPNRWIIRKTSKFGGTPSYAPEMHFIEIGGEDVTSIKNINVNDSDNEWYNVNGVRLSGKPAQKGIYIHNGRKEAVR